MAFLQVLKTAEMKFFGYSCFEASTEYVQYLKSQILYKKVLFLNHVVKNCRIMTTKRHSF